MYIFCFQRKKKNPKVCLIFFLQNGFRKIVVEMSFFSKRKKKQLSFTFLTTQITKQYPKEKNKQTQ